MVCVHRDGIILSLYLFFSQKEMMEVLYNVFQLKIPVWTDDYRAAVASVGETLAISDITSFLTKLQHFFNYKLHIHIVHLLHNSHIDSVCLKPFKHFVDTCISLPFSH